MPDISTTGISTTRLTEAENVDTEAGAAREEEDEDTSISRATDPVIPGGEVEVEVEAGAVNQVLRPIDSGALHKDGTNECKCIVVFTIYRVVVHVSAANLTVMLNQYVLWHEYSQSEMS